MSIPLREQEVKIALINWLYINGHLNDATIINEMVVANWTRRADLAVANGNLHAFEIKSDFDSLKRLEGQLSTFSSHFEKVTVVCSPRFTIEIQEMKNSDIEIIEFISTEQHIDFKIIQKGNQRIIQNKLVYCDFLLKEEIKNLLKEHDIAIPPACSRQQLEIIIETLPLNIIRSHAINSVKKRYLSTSNKYLALLNKDKKITTKHLDLLSRKKQNQPKKNKLALKQVDTEPTIDFHFIDTKKISEKFGCSKKDIPPKVIKRYVIKED